MQDDEEIIEINNDLERKIADVFEIFDHGGNHTCDAREIGTIVRALGCCPTEAEVQEIVMATEETTVPGTVKLTRFMPYMAQLITEHKFQPKSPEEILAAFHLLDPDGRGYLNREQVSTLMTQDGEPFTQDELDEMLEIAIDPHTNTIPYEYYINQLMHEPKEDDDSYFLADEIVRARGPVVVQKRFSEMLAEMATAADKPETENAEAPPAT